ncbi:hypothetical protein [Croceibacterium ferulae]|uniref:hypothetical protein n=1 Tax=Croceibacterium ferulae TaxID=1854641 RepID=UPI000EB53121|nr:hypothetical protein [Croceibacterium ferulae]
MAIIKTERNFVYAYDPEPDDTFVKVAWFGPPQDGKHRMQFHTRPEPIEKYDEAVAWAKEMADQMTFPLYVVPMTSERANVGEAPATGNENGAYGITNDMLDGLHGVEVAAVQRRIAEEQARLEWPANVKAVLELLVERVSELQKRVAALEAGRG